MADLRISLNERAVSRFLPATDGQYLVHDVDLKGFYLLIGKRRRTYMVQGDLKLDGKRGKSVKISVGSAEEMALREARSVAKLYLVELSHGRHPKTPTEQNVESPAGSEITLRQAWDRYREAHMIRKGRSEKTIHNYREHIERHFAVWLDKPVADLANDPALVAERHDMISNENGPYQANASMRTLRAVYNHTRKKYRALPQYNLSDGVDWNREERRNTAMGLADLQGWFEQLSNLSNPLRREFHLLSLLSGSRPTALKAIRPSDLDFRRRVLHIPKPKGGAKRAFDIPLSREMLRSLARAMRYGRMMHPDLAGHWVFPSESATGHLMEQKEERAVLSKWGNDLRQTYRTVATVAGVSEVDAKLLMNHMIPGVNSGYITRHVLLENHLRAQQQAISSVVFRTVGAQNWMHAKRDLIPTVGTDK